MFMRVPFAMLAVAVVCSTHAQAADNIRYVSTTGSNANACTLTAPCRSLQRGIATTPTGGELRILDSGDYGLNARIVRSITVNGNGHTVILGSSLTVDQANAVVALRGLTLNGQGTVVHGINIVNAAKVHIEQSVIHHFTGQGIRATAAGVDVFVLDSISRDNGSDGLLIGAETSRLTVDNSRFENNSAGGIDVGAGIATIHRSIVSGNATHGIAAVDNSVTVTVTSSVTAQNGSTGIFVVAGSTLAMESSLAHGNGDGLFVSNGSTARISNSTFTNNTTGINILTGGTVETR